MALKKNRGESLVTESVGGAGTIPSRWLAMLGTTTTSQEVPLDVGPEPLGISVIESQVIQTRTDERKRVTTNIGSINGKVLRGSEFDRLTGTVMPTEEYLVPAGTQGTALDANGDFVEVQPLNELFSLASKKRATSLVSRTWTSTEHVSLPRVLTMFNSSVFTDVPHWIPYGDLAHTNPLYISAGGNILHVSMQIQLTDYSGVYPVTYTEQWANTPFVGLSATKFRPQGFSWDTPFSTGNVPDCLHTTATISGTTGTTHPTYSYLVWNYVYPATNYTTCVGTVTLSDTQEPHLGGWRRLTKTVVVS